MSPHAQPQPQAQAQAVAPDDGGPPPQRRKKRRRSKRKDPTPYHVGLVAFISYLAAGLPLASLFKVYTYVLCVAFPPSPSSSPSTHTLLTIPPTPSLPFPDKSCPANPQIASKTSSYAAMVTALASILALTSIDRASALTRRFGRKPLMLLMHILLILGYTVVRFGVALSQASVSSERRKSGIPGLVLVIIGAILAETAQGAPLRIALQNYIVDTVPNEDDNENEHHDHDDEHNDDNENEDENEHTSSSSPSSSRASALSFLDGIGQLGGFPSSTLGGLLASLTAAFFAPFYAAVVCVGIAFAWALLGVPESKTDREHIAFIDGFDPAGRESVGGSVGEAEEGEVREERAEEGPKPRITLRARIRQWFQFINFLRPLTVFAPVRNSPPSNQNSSTSSSFYDLRLPILALLILAEETYQAFLLPAFLLYCSDVFGYDQLQEGYLVSILQGTRAAWLTFVFPRLLGWARGLVGRRAERRARQAEVVAEGEGEGESEGTPLLRSANRGQNENVERAITWAKARLDMLVLILSYLLSILAFLLIASARAAASGPEGDHSNKRKQDDGGLRDDGGDDGGKKAWWTLIVGIVVLQLASGSSSVRTALVVNAASGSSAARERLSSRAHHAVADDDDDPSSEPGSHIERQEGGEDDETSTSTAESLALAANQILITITTALMPILTSLVYSRGLQAKPVPVPEAVWIFKAGVAGVSAVVCVGLALEGERVGRRERRS
ncbi:hypothetical protein A4X06_0g4123 [Tilletia controversa]|uniref:Uncharacterized protein n=1 Tax=Tilletia controversa TaxID=13291 RepID=A0A8X7SXJ3_9BASI|nr:hypothetical protein A4X06_0g4123 [Tilletia controversa]